jgi:hypothetical protein
VANRVNKTEDTLGTNRTLSEKEINDLFETLNLSSASDREKFLRLEQLSEEPNPGPNHIDDGLLVRFRDSTARDPAMK